jgi:superfamily II DNA/RNA helicase
VLASAKTGTGKTAAFMLPTLNRLHITKRREEAAGIKRDHQPLVLVLVPTRELADQVRNANKKGRRRSPDWPQSFQYILFC